MDVGNINWSLPNGISLDQLNDYRRNQYFDSVLPEVKGKHCLDVGPGSGILSLLAIKHGAASVIVYEPNVDKYAFIVELITRLNLTQVTVINELFDHTCYKKHPEVDVVISESTNKNIWDDHFFDRLPRTPDYNFIPGHYFVEIHANTISRQFAVGLVEHITNVYKFNPGIELDTEHINAVSKIYTDSKKYWANTYNDNLIPNTIVELPHQPTIWSGLIYEDVVKTNIVSYYSIDVSKNEIQAIDRFGYDLQKLNFDDINVDLYIDAKQWKDECVLLVGRFGYLHNGHKYYFKEQWEYGSPSTAVLLVNPDSHLIVRHSLQSGKLTYRF